MKRTYEKKIENKLILFIICFIFLNLLFMENVCSAETIPEQTSGMVLPTVEIGLNGVLLSQVNAGSKETKYTGNSFSLSDPNNNEHDFTDTDVEFKGRGNASWTKPQRSYQIKLSKKQNVLGMGKSKTWLLIAQYTDPSLMRAKLMYNLAEELSMPYTTNCQWVQVYIDNEYLGVYLLCEKVQVGDNRVELKDSTGLIVELDNNYYSSEPHYFASNYTGAHFVLKDSVADDDDQPDSVALSSFNDFKTALNAFEMELYSDTPDWGAISRMIDVDSFIRYYYLQEFAEDPDGMRSSFFFYKDGPDDVIHLGPVWDYESALGNYASTSLGGNPEIDYVLNIKDYMSGSIDWFARLFAIRPFKQAAYNKYQSEIKSVLESSADKLDGYYSFLSNQVNAHFIKWQNLNKNLGFGRVTGQTFYDEVQFLKNWIDRRNRYLSANYAMDTETVGIGYSSHVSDIGWVNTSYSGNVSGTIDSRHQIEAIKIDLDTFNPKYSDSGISYRTYSSKNGWEMNWQSNGVMSGTTGQSLPIKGIEMKLTGKIAEDYDVQYCVHTQNGEWTEWISSETSASEKVYDSPIDGICILLIEKEKEIILDSDFAIIGETKTVYPGTKCGLDLNLQNNPGICYLRITVKTIEGITIKSVENGNVIKDLDQGTNLLWSAVGDSTSNGNMATLHFEVEEDVSEGEYPIQIIVRECYNATGQKVDIKSGNGKIIVSDSIFGDTNGDMKVNGLDVLLLRQYMANFDDETGTSTIAVESGSDANGDGKTNGLDILLLRQYMANYDDETGTSTVALGRR